MGISYEVKERIAVPKKEYIERETADKELYTFIHELDRVCANAESLAVFEALTRIRRLPIVDVEPVRHGGWIWEEEAERYRCSSCRISYDYDKTYELFDHGFQFASFCPNCGARMDMGAAEAVEKDGEIERGM